WLHGVLEGAGLDAPAAETVISPPEPSVDFLAALGRQRLVVDGFEQLLGALERDLRLRLTCLLHRADRLRGELADLAAQRPETGPRDGARAPGGYARTPESRVQQSRGCADPLPLDEGHHDLLVRRP